MSETHQAGSHEPRAYAGPETFDTEIGVRASIMTMVWVFGTSIVSALLMWLMMLGFGKLETRSAEPMTPIQEAHRQTLPPEPRLERSPYQNLDEMRAEEDKLLDEPGWVDREQGVVRLSIDEAIGVLAERGLPQAAAPPTAVPPAGQTQPGSSPAVPPDAQAHPPAPPSRPVQPPTDPSRPPAPPAGGHS